MKHEFFGTCVHEASHATVAILSGYRVSHLMARAPDGTLHQGELGIEIPGADTDMFKSGQRFSFDGVASGVAVHHGLAVARIALAGGIAESRWSGVPVKTIYERESGPDFSTAMDIAAALHPEAAERRAFIKSVFADVLETVYRPLVWATIKAIAKELAPAGRLNGARVHELAAAKLAGMSMTRAPEDMFSKCLAAAARTVVGRVNGFIPGRLSLAQQDMSRIGPWEMLALDSPDGESFGRRLAASMLAGGPAVSRFNGIPIARAFADGADPSYRAAVDLAGHLAKSDQARRIFVRGAFAESLASVRAPRIWVATFTLANILEVDRELSAADVRRILRFKGIE